MKGKDPGGSHGASRSYSISRMLITGTFRSASRGHLGFIKYCVSPALPNSWKPAGVLAGAVDSDEPGWAMLTMVIVIHALSRRADPVSTEMGSTVPHHLRFTKHSLVCYVLFHCMKRRERPVLVNPVLISVIPPTKETAPRQFIVIRIWIVHKLWVFILPKEPSMMCGIFVVTSGIELGGAWCRS